MSKPKSANTPAAARRRFDCSKCPGFCCNYELIPITERDLDRLARHFGLTQNKAGDRFTKIVDGELCLRTRKDHIYKATCMLFDREKRRCSAYAGRPRVCRTYPNGNRCGYFEFLLFERRLQGDDTFIPDA